MGAPRAGSRRAVARSEAGGIIADIEFDGDRFMADLVSAVAAMEVASERALWVIALQVQNQARLLAPVDTGRLRSSIMAVKAEGGRVVDIGTNVKYAAYVEFGTRHMAAQPYLRPALARAAGYIPVAMRGAM